MTSNLKINILTNYSKININENTLTFCKDLFNPY